MELIYVVVIFVLILLNLAMLKFGGWLFPLIFGAFSLIMVPVALGQSANIPYHPYPQMLLALVAAVCMFHAAVVYKRGF